MYISIITSNTRITVCVQYDLCELSNIYCFLYYIYYYYNIYSKLPILLYIYNIYIYNNICIVYTVFFCYNNLLINKYFCKNVFNNVRYLKGFPIKSIVGSSPISEKTFRNLIYSLLIICFNLLLVLLLHLLLLFNRQLLYSKVSIYRLLY